MSPQEILEWHNNGQVDHLERELIPILIQASLSRRSYTQAFGPRATTSTPYSM